MDLIFADENLIDQGVLLDYSFDECYGVDNNTFECKIQQYNDAVTGLNDVKPISQDFFMYIEFTEYGGIVDRVESNTKSGEITFTGRTWHGIMDSYVIQPPEGKVYRLYEGEINDVLAQMLDDIGMSSLFVVDIVPLEDRTVEVVDFNVRYEKMYHALLRLMNLYNCKLLCYFQSGQVHLGVSIIANYATNEEFDSSQVPFTVGETYNNCNHLICLGAGDATDRAVIHLFMDDNENLQPYAKVDIPKQDSDYYLDESQKVMFGMAEVADILDLPNSEIITNYLPQETRPTDWVGAYWTKYYYLKEDNGKEKYELFKLFYRDEYRLQATEPSDWKDNHGFEDYYYWDDQKDPQYYRWNINEETGKGCWAKCNQSDEGAVLKAGAFVNVKALTGVAVTTTYEEWDHEPEDWGDKYSSYYIRTGVTPTGDYAYASVPAESYVTWGIGGTKQNPNGQPLSKAPTNWSTDFASYFYRVWRQATSSYEYIACSGTEVVSEKKITKKSIPRSEWAETWNRYYVIANSSLKKNKKITKKKGKYITASDAFNNGQLKKDGKNNYPKYSKNTYYELTITYKAKPFANYKNGKIATSGVFAKFTHNEAPSWEAHKYYYSVVHDIPTWTAGKYYTKYPDVKQVPIYDATNCYYAVEDRMRMLVEAGIEKLNELCDKSTLDINLELESNYDVGDIVGSIDEVTKIEVYKPILRKIIKIKEYVLSISYEVE